MTIIWKIINVLKPKWVFVLAKYSKPMRGFVLGPQNSKPSYVHIYLGDSCRHDLIYVPTLPWDPIIERTYSLIFQSLPAPPGCQARWVSPTPVPLECLSSRTKTISPGTETGPSSYIPSSSKMVNWTLAGKVGCLSQGPITHSSQKWAARLLISQACTYIIS